MVTNLSSGPLKYDVQPNFRSNCATKNPKYHYFQGERELPHLVALFRESQYRYLHISCHGSQTEIFTTNGAMSYARFAQFFSGHLRLRRLVVSACELGNNMFVDLIAASNKGMHSIVAPAQTIQYDHAAAIWSAFYVSMFSERYASNVALPNRSQARRAPAAISGRLLFRRLQSEARSMEPSSNRS